MKSVSIKQLEAILILDSDGKRIAVKYYNDRPLFKGDNKSSNLNMSRESLNCNFQDTYNNFQTVEDQKLFESDITDKIKKLGINSDETEIVVLNKYIILCLLINDINIYIIGDDNDNEIILNEVMQTINQCLNSITNNQIGKKQLIDKLDYVYLILDEIADSGIIMETNSNIIVNRLYMQEGEVQDPTPLNQAISSAKENIIRSLLSGT